MEKCIKKMKQTITVFLVFIIIFTMLPVNFAYGATAPNVKNMKKTKLVFSYTGVFSNQYNYSYYTQHPNDSGPVYRDPTNQYGDGSWRKDTIDGKGVTRPGETDNASMGFAVDLDAHNMLGAALKGQLTATNSIYYDNYKGDDDYGRPFITFYNKDGNSLGTHSGENKSVSNWVDNRMNKSVPSNAAYIIYGAYAKRSGGFLNKDLDFNLNKITGYVIDTTKPYVVSVKNDYPEHMTYDTEIIRQNTQAQEPNIYITVSEDCTFSGAIMAKLISNDGINTVPLDFLGEYNFNSTNGDVTYKFRIRIEELYNNNIYKHFNGIEVSFTLKDTFGNTSNSYVTLNKRIDTMPPVITNDIYPNIFKVSDLFGLSKITATMTSSKNISNTNSILDVEKNKTTVKSAYKSSDELDSIKKGMLTIQNNTNITDVFNVTIEASDLVYDTSSLYGNRNTTKILRELFLISNQQPLKFKLKNSNNPLLDISPDDVNKYTDYALTNMYLTTDIAPKYLNEGESPVIYYKWGAYDENILTEDPVAKNWNKVSFKQNSNETEPISVPVIIKNEGEGDYLYPVYKDGGYLYIIPNMQDASTNGLQLRTGSMALKYDGTESLDADNNNGYFTLTSNPVTGEFINRGCDCTGQGEGISDITHYGFTGNHKKDIGFNVTKNHEYLSSIKYYISQENNIASYIDQGSILKNSSGEYNIPISSISNRTGRYTVILALYSNKGDVTVHEIPVDVESPVIGVSNILYNQVNQNLDFTVTYSRNSIVDGKLEDIQIEFGNGTITAFQDETEDLKDYISLYAISESGVLPKENWDTDIGDKEFVRTEFIASDKDSNLMTAQFRASLLNMEKAGDSFIKTAGEKRVHLKYTSSNKVEVFNNNVTVIKKSNLPPIVRMSEGTVGTYMTAEEYNNSVTPFVSITIEEPIVDLKYVYYDWVSNADSTLINDDGTISGKSLTLSSDSAANLLPKDITNVSGQELYKPYYLAVYAENSTGKYVEKSFGPFYVLNDNINDERFEITATDKAMGENQIFISVDDKLHMVDELHKPDKVRALWQQNQINILKTYDISFAKDEGTKNVAVVNIPYIGLSDTNGAGGTFVLSSIDIYNSTDDTTFKSIYPIDIKQVLPEYFVEINAENVKSSFDEIKYQWVDNPYDMPTSWVTTNGAISGMNFAPAEAGSYIHNRMYLFLNIWNNIYRTEKFSLIVPEVADEIKTVSIKIGESENGYYGMENGEKNNTLIRISTKNSTDLKNIVKVDFFDQLGVSSGTAIRVGKLYKISETEAAGIIPGSLVTSGGAIKCRVSVNGFDIGEITSDNVGAMENGNLIFNRDNRTVNISNVSEYLNYSLYQNDGIEYKFDVTGETEIYEDGNYLLVYKDGTNIFAKELVVKGVEYVSDDITSTLSPVKPLEGKVKEPVEATIAMPFGSVITDKYGVINNVAVIGDDVVATAVITRSAIYSFKIKFANEQVTEHEINIDYIDEDYTPSLSLVTSSSAISYSLNGPQLTIEDVTANINEAYSVLNNDRITFNVFNRNGSYSFILKDAENNIKEYDAKVSWIDKDFPEPVTKKYVWYDFNNDGKIDVGEKGAEITSGYKTKNNVIVEITFPHESEGDRPVKLQDISNFTMEDISNIEGYAYKFIYAYNPSISEGTTPDYKENLTFIDTLGNVLDYKLVINEIDRTDLLTQLNYSTTNYTNRDVVVSMSANRPIKRFDIVEGIEKDASPTYVFKENGTKDFNYRQIEIADDDPLEGTLTANVTWIDKSVPTVNVEFNNTITNNDVVIKFKVIDGVSENANLKFDDETITLTDSGNDRTGSFTVNKNDNYRFEVSNKYGNAGDIFVPVYNIDKEKPVLNIKGREHVYLKVGEKYYDQGAYAIDNMDGDITSGIKVASTVNTLVSLNTPYQVTYTIMDSAGNTSTKTRYVHVLDIDSAVAIIQDNVINLRSQDVHNIQIGESGVVYTEFVGIDGKYVTKYAKGEDYDNNYFKINGSYLSKLGTFTAQKGMYTLYLQDQERNTRIIKLNFYK
ncbi:MAG: DUF5011 domain-containing protein [Sedimentibacter sp.]